MKKISKMHQRVLSKMNGVSSGRQIREMVYRRQALAKTERPAFNPHPKPGFYVACMGVEEAVLLNHTDAVVISIRSPGSSSMKHNFAAASAFFEIFTDPDEESRVEKEVVLSFNKFIKDNLAVAKKIHIHCTYGEIRSRSVAMGITQAIQADVGYGEDRTCNVNCYEYTTLRGFLAIPHTQTAPHQSLSYLGYRAARNAMREDESGDIKNNLITYSESDLSPN